MEVNHPKHAALAARNSGDYTGSSVLKIFLLKTDRARENSNLIDLGHELLNCRKLQAFLRLKYGSAQFCDLFAKNPVRSSETFLCKKTVVITLEHEMFREDATTEFEEEDGRSS